MIVLFIRSYYERLIGPESFRERMPLTGTFLTESEALWDGVPLA